MSLNPIFGFEEIGIVIHRLALAKIIKRLCDKVLGKLRCRNAINREVIRIRHRHIRRNLNRKLLHPRWQRFFHTLRYAERATQRPAFRRAGRQRRRCNHLLRVPAHILPARGVSSAAGGQHAAQQRASKQHNDRFFQPVSLAFRFRKLWLRLSGDNDSRKTLSSPHRMVNEL
ncbi:hypothetical protein SDC9_140230 [bioreactor metagenome]|uniref:Uncharacterized protein n=1 Tax=bioreactor metagenome TaxID=1076179 RepID=A0A645DU96_9ZZZZ